MTKHTNTKKNRIVKKVLKKRLGDLLDWEKPIIHDTVGPYAPAIFDRYSELLERTKAAVHNTLAKHTPEELDMVISPQGKLNTKLLQSWHGFPHADIKRLIQTEPFWFQGGFGNEGHKANFDYWARMDTLSLIEATCLTIGFAPESFNEEQFSEWSQSDPNGVLEFFEKRRIQIKCKFQLSNFSDFGNFDLYDDFERHKVRFEELWEWVVRVKLDVAPEFIASFQEIADQGYDVGLATAPEKLDHREKVSLAQLLTALAISELGYVPDALRSPIPKEIQDMVEKLGLEISDDTIRKYLKLGASHLPDGWQDD